MTADDHFTRPARKRDVLERTVQVVLFTTIAIISSFLIMSSLTGFMLFTANAALEGAVVMQEQELGMMEDVASETGTDLLGCLAGNEMMNERIGNCHAALGDMKDRLYAAKEDNVRLSSSLWEVPFVEMNHQVNEDNEYDLFTNNCVAFSDDLAGRLRAMGYSAKPFPVRVNCTSGWFDREICDIYGNRHMIVMLRLPIDPTLGKVIRPEDYWVYNLEEGVI